MAENKIIAATLQVDTGNSNANIKEVNKNLNEVKTSLKDTGTQATKTGSDVSTSTGHFTKLKDQMSALPGPLGQAGDGVNKLGTAFKALLANPVVLVLTAIVGVLALMYKAFTNTFEGGQKMEQIFAGIKAAGQALLDNLSKIGSAIVKVFQFDFSGAMADIKGVADAAGDAYSQMSKLTKEAQGLKKEQLANDLDAAKRAKDLAILREKANDESVPLSERKKLLNQLYDAAKQNATDDIALAKKVSDNKIAQLTLEKDGALKNQDEINRIKIEQINVETDNANELRRIGKQITAAEKQEQADRVASNKEALAKKNQDLADAKAKQKEITDAGNRAIADAEQVLNKALDRDGQLALLKKQYQERIDAAQKAKLSIIKIQLAYFQELAELQKKFADEDAEKKAKADAEDQAFLDAEYEKQKAQEEADVTRSMEDTAVKKKLSDEEKETKIRNLQAVGDATNALADLVGKQTVAGKALGIATALINTYQGASEVIKQKSTLPSPFDIISKVAGVATIIATGIKTVKAITAVQVPGGGGGGSVSTPSISPAAPIAPTVAGSLVNQSQANSTNNATVRAYVVSADISNDQSRTERLNKAARLGG